MNPFETLALELKRLLTGYREESYYRSLCEFLEVYGNDKEYLHMLNIVATSNPNSESVVEGAGFPDIELRQNRRLIGYIEVKPPTQNLDNPSFAIQFNRYKEAFENIVFTNFKKWILYTWDKDGKPQKTAEAEWDLETDLSAETLKKLLTVFFEGSSYEARTPHQLALALARKTKLLRNQVENAVTEESPNEKLLSLKKTFERTLIQDISDHQFANIYAETIAYALFLAKLEHFEKGSNVDFTLRTAVDFLPKNVPIFKDLYQLTGGTIEPITPEIYKATEILIEQLNYADIERIYKKLVEHKPGEDPVIQFYEPFLAEYDPKEREARGVYYTPKPVVDYIVRSVDYILKTKFNKPKGLGDESIQILDPATGTGTFLMSVIQNIYADIEKENKPLGEDLVKRKFNEVVSSHILKHLYGFELLVAPYAIAHLKLTLELERLGFDFSLTEGDQDKDNDRLKIFLANTLDDPEKPPLSLFGFESIVEESEKARKVKKEEPILVITGNPPYSGISQNPVEMIVYKQLKNGKTQKKKIRTWIGDLIEDYKYLEGDRRTGEYFGERKHWLGDDYVKFIRFAHWKIQQHKKGIVAMITNNGFLDNPTFRAMRYQLLNEFDQIYIFDLHGNSKRKEEDENVFEQVAGVGTSISFLIKNDSLNKKVFRADLYGKRKQKWGTLQESNIEGTPWKEVIPHKPLYLFEITDSEAESDETLSLEEVFLDKRNKTTGVQTSRDSFSIGFTVEELKSRFSVFTDLSLTDEYLKDRFKLEDTRGWKLEIARRSLSKLDWQSMIFKYGYNPFDKRYVLWNINAIDWPRTQVMKHMIHLNLALCVGRAGIAVGGDSWNLVFCTDSINDLNLFYRGGSVSIPLYLYEDTSSQMSLLGVGGGLRTQANLSPVFTKKISEKLKMSFIESGRGDLENKFGPEDVFYYIYAIFHSPNYRYRYKEQLRRDFPKLPLTSDKELFMKLVQKGNELVNLHLLGKNPFDKSETIFDDTSKWKVSIGGEKPEDIEDWKVTEVRYDEKTKRVYINSKQYFEGIEKEVWKFMVGGYQVLDKWLKDRKKAERTLSPDDQIHYMKIIVSLRETIKIMKEIDEVIPEWPMR